ncbi:MAG: CopG family transcriptional regulator [Jatrophihabitantaceae bacterium]
MAMKRTTVFADEDDLATIKAAAARRGVPEAEILRDAIHLAAMANRTWSEPFFTHTYSPDDGAALLETAEVLQATWDDQGGAYQRTTSPAP